MNTIKVNIPDYITIGQLQSLQDLVGDTPTMRMLEQVSIITNKDVDEIKQWPLELISKVFAEVSLLVESYNPTFHAVFEYNGKMWGYNQLSKMDLASYIDLENLSKDTMLNLNEIIAILYRPIVSHKLDSLSFQAKNTWKWIRHNSSEPVFDYYELEPYSNFTRKDIAKEVEGFPSELVMGGLLFFLMSGAQHLRNMETSSLNYLQMRTLSMLENLQNPLLDTTVGLQRFTNSHKLPSYQSGDKRVSLN
jgi:hypothetical protein